MAPKISNDCLIAAGLKLTIKQHIIANIFHRDAQNLLQKRPESASKRPKSVSKRPERLKAFRSVSGLSTKSGLVAATSPLKTKQVGGEN